MNWMDWAVVGWIVLALCASLLIGVWLGRSIKLADDDAEQTWPVVPGQTPLADLMNDEFSQTQARAAATARRTDTQTYLAASAVSGEVLEAEVRGPRHVSTETVGIPVIDVWA